MKRVNIEGLDLNGTIPQTANEIPTNVNELTGFNDLELVANKVISIDSNSTNDEYPSAKCVYDLVGDIASLLAQI